MATETVRKDGRQRPLQQMAATAFILTNSTSAPSNPYDGMIVYANGVDWNPGSGEGVYAYYNSQWNKL